MVAVPTPRSGQPRYPQSIAGSSEFPPAGSASFPAPSQPAATANITHFVAAGTLLAGGALIATGHRRAGVAVAAAGTAIALFQEQEAVKEWWQKLPGFLSDAQTLLDKIEGYLAEATIQGQRLQGILRR
jgi:hypothetical protein